MKRKVAIIIFGGLMATSAAASPALSEDPGAAGGAVSENSIGTLKTRRVNIPADATQVRGRISGFDATENGRLVAFSSSATNLVAGDGNKSFDVFVKDTETGGIEIVSVGSDGALGNGYSISPSISSDGRYVAFASSSDNLVPGDTNGWEDIFVHDRATATTERISLSTEGEEANVESFSPVISDDGRFVVFGSNADNLTSQDDNPYLDLFLRDRELGTTEMVNVSSDEVQAEAFSLSLHPQISADGRYVAFHSDAKNLVPNDNNGDDRHWVDDVFLRDRVEGTTTLVSVSTSGKQGNSASSAPAMTPDGRFIAFESLATNFARRDRNRAYDVFVRDLVEGTTRRASLSSKGRRANGVSLAPSISPDGRFVAFASLASNLVGDDTNGEFDIFRRDLERRRTVRISVNSRGKQARGNRDWLHSHIAAGGHWVIFESSATNLVRGDTNRAADIFMRGPYN